MTKTEALKLASGYAWGAEDFSRERMATPEGKTDSPSYLFAVAFADAQEAYNTEKRGVMPSVTSAYATWQMSNGRTVLYQDM
jgi:hypothetical protein